LAGAGIGQAARLYEPIHAARRTSPARHANPLAQLLSFAMLRSRSLDEDAALIEKACATC